MKSSQVANAYNGTLDFFHVVARPRGLEVGRCLAHWGFVWDWVAGKTEVSYAGYRWVVTCCISNSEVHYHRDKCSHFFLRESMGILKEGRKVLLY